MARRSPEGAGFSDGRDLGDRRAARRLRRMARRRSRRAHRDRLDCDAVVISDTTMWAADVPSMCTGMRGLTEVEISLHGPSSDLHSGSFGGAVPNPLHAMVTLLASLHDADGRVTLPGF